MVNIIKQMLQIKLECSASSRDNMEAQLGRSIVTRSNAKGIRAPEDK